MDESECFGKSLCKGIEKAGTANVVVFKKSRRFIFNYFNVDGSAMFSIHGYVVWNNKNVPGKTFDSSILPAQCTADSRTWLRIISIFLHPPNYSKPLPLCL